MKHFGSTNYWVIAEISKINEKSGHRYLDLVDSENGKTTALMSGNIWASTYHKLEQKIGKDLPSILESGNKVLILVQIEYHRIFGLKLNIRDIDPSFSYGEIERKKQETIERLKNEGLFDLQKQLYLPVIAKRIAVIGSPGTSGFRDFMNELQENEVYRNFKIKEFPASVQGEKATLEIIKALTEASQYDIDVIVIIRGGGSKMDLNIFNDYELSKAICLSKKPIITGIGHESDEFVADLVCRNMCITPTAAAKFLYIQIGMFSSNLRTSFDTIKNQALSLLAVSKDEFYHTNKYLVHHSQQFLLEYQVELRNEAHLLQLGFLDLIHAEKSELNLLLSKSRSSAIHKIQLLKDSDLPSKLEKIKMMAINYTDQKKLEVMGLNDLLTMLDPQRLLENGYTISTIDDVDVYKISADLIDKEMRTLTANAIITSKITKTEKK